MQILIFIGATVLDLGNKYGSYGKSDHSNIYFPLTRAIQYVQYACEGIWQQGHPDWSGKVINNQYAS